MQPEKNTIATSLHVVCKW